jgi:hypothetical protein
MRARVFLFSEKSSGYEVRYTMVCHWEPLRRFGLSSIQHGEYLLVVWAA